MSKLIVPRRLAKKYQEVTKQENPEKQTELSESALGKMPEPTGWRVLILPYKGKGKTEGGVFIPDQAVEREALATVCGYVLKIGPLAFKDKEKFGETYNPWCKEKDWVIFGRYAGSRFRIDGGEVRLLNDDEILATINNPEDILHTQESKMAEAQKQEELPLEVDNEEVEVDLQETKEEVKVEQVEDAKEAEVEDKGEEGLDGYSKKVRKRIEEMTYKIREAERREKAAIEYAQGLQKENKALAERSKTIDDSYIKEYDARVTSEEATLKTKLAEAISAGDVEAQVNINKDLARLAVEAERLSTAKIDRETQLKEAEAKAKEPQQQAPKQVNPKAQAWAQRNTWFGSDDPMTLTAFSIHNDLIRTNGEQYALTDEYYTTIDQKIREAFPHKFEGEKPQTTSVNTPVAPATRSSGAKSPKKVTLSKSEVAIAKKLGVSLEQYAKQKQNLATT